MKRRYETEVRYELGDRPCSPVGQDVHFTPRSIEETVAVVERLRETLQRYKNRDAHKQEDTTGESQ